MYLNEVKGHFHLELATTFGISALVTAFLKHKQDVTFAGIIFSLQVSHQLVNQQRLLWLYQLLATLIREAKRSLEVGMLHVMR